MYSVSGNNNNNNNLLILLMSVKRIELPDFGKKLVCIYL